MTLPEQIPVYGFTSKTKQITRILRTKVRISQAFNPQKNSHQQLKEYLAIWDTGATNSVITEKVVNECGLKPIGVVKVGHIDGESLSDVFLINMVLPNNVGIPELRVTRGKITGNVDVLIGMDVITKGDFTLSNFHGETWFSFRIPSVASIDLSDEKFRGATPSLVTPSVNPYAKIGRNDPCPCGSGKKYKKCCGKNK